MKKNVLYSVIKLSLLNLFLDYSLVVEELSDEIHLPDHCANNSKAFNREPCNYIIVIRKCRFNKNALFF